MEPATISSGLEPLIREVFADTSRVESVSVFSRSGLVIIAEAKKLHSRPELLGSMVSVAFAALEEAMSGSEQHLVTLTASYAERMMVVQPLSPTLLQVVFVPSIDYLEEAIVAMGKLRTRVGSELSWLR